MTVFVPSNDGRWVSEKFLNLAEVVRDYDPQFELRWVPPEQRSDPTDHSRAYCIWDTVANAPCMFAGEDAEPSEILAHLFTIDNDKHNVFEMMEARNNAVRALELKDEMEKRLEKQEYVKWLMQTQKNYIHLRNQEGELHVYDDQFREIR